MNACTVQCLRLGDLDLRGFIMAADHNLLAAERWEAARLEWGCRHVPVGTLLLVCLLGTGVVSAVSSMWVL